MMTPCKKLYYAVEAVLYIAYNAGAQPISSREIARQQGLPPRYLEQIMQKLVHGGILKGVRGPKGGYVMAREHNKVTLGDICQMLEEEHLISETPATTPLGDRVVRPLWEGLWSNTIHQLAKVTIDELCVKATSLNIQKRDAQKMDSPA